MSHTSLATARSKNNSSKSPAKQRPSLVMPTDKYSKFSLIASGSFGKVYSAIQKDSLREVALQIIKADQNINKQTLDNEIQILNKVKGPGIPQLYSYDSEIYFTYISMQLVGLDCGSLMQVKGGKLSLQFVLVLAMKLLGILQHVHQLGILHRDLKPENICLGPKTEKNQIYLIDFGIAKSFRKTDGTHRDEEQNQGFFGTPIFCSLRAQQGLTQSRRDDLQSLGYNLIYMLKGTLPWVISGKKHKDFSELGSIKTNYTTEKLCMNTNQCFDQYFTIVQNLSFKEEPDYAKLQKLFKTAYDEHFSDHLNGKLDLEQQFYVPLTRTAYQQNEDAKFQQNQIQQRGFSKEDDDLFDLQLKPVQIKEPKPQNRPATNAENGVKNGPHKKLNQRVKSNADIKIEFESQYLNPKQAQSPDNFLGISQQQQVGNPNKEILSANFDEDPQFNHMVDSSQQEQMSPQFGQQEQVRVFYERKNLFQTVKTLPYLRESDQNKEEQPFQPFDNINSNVETEYLDEDDDQKSLSSKLKSLNDQIRSISPFKFILNNKSQYPVPKKIFYDNYYPLSINTSTKDIYSERSITIPQSIIQ